VFLSAAAMFYYRLLEIQRGIGVRVMSNEIMCIQNFIEISHQVPEFNLTHTHKEHCYCVSVFWFRFRRKFSMNL
jgi:hypothetical protein